MLELLPVSGDGRSAAAASLDAGHPLACCGTHRLCFALKKLPPDSFEREQKIAVKTIASIFTIPHMWLRNMVLFLAREPSPHPEVPNMSRRRSAIIPSRRVRKQRQRNGN
ncbi:hypothetical protein AV530_016790 [Patagioenas fasciata monilis]|uniref:Uncharacterized protein n=1 Tax=Patagioenas fasciata monilis TaxID=372326 RepID=A0A1V4J4S5_PATFA|nr:hypothetical protein AV530_016790 [Patagioenas fasciata monilis]